MKTKRKQIRQYTVVDKHNRHRMIGVSQEITIVSTIHDDRQQEVAGPEEHRVSTKGWSPRRDLTTTVPQENSNGCIEYP